MKMQESQSEKSEIDQKYLTFALEDETYGIAVRQVIGIVQVDELIPVPHTEPFFLGLMDVRGQVIPLIDLKIKLNLKLDQETKGERAIITDIHGKRIALLVDRVFHVEVFEQDKIDTAPPSIQDSSANYVMGIGKSRDNFIVLLSLEGLFTDEDFQKLTL